MKKNVNSTRSHVTQQECKLNEDTKGCLSWGTSLLFLGHTAAQRLEVLDKEKICI